MLTNVLGRSATPMLRPGCQGLNQISRLNNAQEVQSRNAATLKTLQIRMKAIRNMQKITKAMKMVAAAKMRKDQQALDNGLNFCQPVLDLFKRLPHEEKAGNITYLGVTSDKGLCGGVNSVVSKNVRLGVLDEESKGNAAKIMMMGQKGPGALKRMLGDRFTVTFEDIAKSPWTFHHAAMIGDRIAALKPLRLKVVSNEFVNAAVYKTNVQHAITVDEAMTIDKAEWTKAMDVYSFEPSVYEVFNDLHDFYLGCMIHKAQLHSSICETSQRMSAMENATKNAGEMLEKVSLQFNRARQAKITTELCEIISGAAAV